MVGIRWFQEEHLYKLQIHNETDGEDKAFCSGPCPAGLWKFSKNGHSTTSLSNMLQCFSTLLLSLFSLQCLHSLHCLLSLGIEPHRNLCLFCNLLTFPSNSFPSGQSNPIPKSLDDVIQPQNHLCGPPLQTPVCQQSPPLFPGILRFIQPT